MEDPAATCKPHVRRCLAAATSWQLQSEHKAPSPLINEVGCWPEADMTVRASDVRFRGAERTSARARRMSANDPNATSSFIRAGCDFTLVFFGIAQACSQGGTCNGASSLHFSVC